MRVLHTLHDFLPRHTAGSEIYVYELARQQRRRGHEVHVLCAEYDLSRPHGSLTWRWYDELPVTELVNHWRFGSFAETYASKRLGEALTHVLRAVAPEVVHVHNLLNLSFDLPVLAAARAIPCVATLHDYTLLCPSGGQRVHQAEKHVCFEIDTARCARCFPSSAQHAQVALARLAGGARGLRWAGRAARSILARAPRIFGRLARTASSVAALPVTAEDVEKRLRAARERVFRHIDLFVAPSPFLAAEYRRFGLPAEKLRVDDLGFATISPTARRSPPAPEGRLRIGFVGTLAWVKGVHLLIEAARRLPAERIEVLLFGGLETFPDYVARLRRAADGLPVRFLGAFERDRTAQVYAAMDVLVVPSLWPENSPLVIHEAFMAGVPVVGARLGGICDLVRHGESGLLYDAFSAAELAAALRTLVDDPAEVARMARQLPGIKSIEEDARQWDRRYREVTHRD